MKKLGFFVLAIAAALLIFGFVLACIIQGTFEKAEIRNDSEKLKKLHCLDQLCVEKMEVIYDNKQKMGNIRFYIKNTGDTSLSAGFIKVVFDNDEEQEVIFRYSEFLPNDTQSVDIQFTNKDIIKANNYEFKQLSEKELESLNY